MPITVNKVYRIPAAPEGIPQPKVDLQILDAVQKLYPRANVQYVETKELSREKGYRRFEIRRAFVLGDR